MNKPKMVMEHDHLLFEWHGGEYVHVFEQTANEPVVLHAINVFDYFVGKPKIGTLHEFATVCRNYIAENYGEDEPDIAEIFFGNVKDGSRNA